ncbi:hypothetical protein, partial [Petrotoga sp. DB-2]
TVKPYRADGSTLRRVRVGIAPFSFFLKFLCPSPALKNCRVEYTRHFCLIKRKKYDIIFLMSFGVKGREVTGRSAIKANFQISKFSINF